ncbi:kelch repeat-containing protein [Sorangium sp. So ce136]|uniref:Kelch repeat-containing protein n=1 Tax=Sorangium sp. So ce136 TaxID=3133284 RepID=UPI003EFD1678
MLRTALRLFAATSLLLVTRSTSAAPPWIQSTMPLPHAIHSAVALPGGEVLVIGGSSGGDYPYLAQRAVDRYDPATGTWTSLSPPTYPYMSGFGGVLLPDGRVLVVAGPYGNESYVPATDTWTQHPGLASVSQEYYCIDMLPQQVVLLSGGYVEDVISSDSHLIDPATLTVISTVAMRGARATHRTTVLPDGRVLAVGGARNLESGHGTRTVADAEIYDPMTASWAWASSMHSRRQGHQATLLLDGRVLVTGGGVDIFSPEIYDPQTDTWTIVAPMSVERYGHTMTTLPSGRVLVTGGFGDQPAIGSYYDSAEIYDPHTDTWTSFPPMSSARSDHTATYIPGKGLLVAGGAPIGIWLDSATDSADFLPLGAIAAGGACVIDEECAIGACIAGICDAGGSGGAGSTSSAGGAGGSGTAEGAGGSGGAGGSSVSGGAGGSSVSGGSGTTSGSGGATSPGSGGGGCATSAGATSGGSGALALLVLGLFSRRSTRAQSRAGGSRSLSC